MSTGMLRIPFALRLEDKALVGPEEVPRGAACGCICPSCKLPLIANQGEDKAWHFSHNTRGHDREVARECDYSFYVSLAAMVKQIMREGLPVKLPEFRPVLKYPPHHRDAVQSSVLVTHQTTFEPTGIEIDVEVNGHICDLVLWHNEHRLAIFLVHPEKHAPQMMSEALRDPRVGVLELDLTGMGAHYGQLRVGEVFKEEVKRYLQESLASKRWIYHPRAERMCRPELERLEARWNALLSERPLIGTVPPPLVQATRTVRYSCICGNEYTGTLPGISSCPACRRASNLYATMKPVS